MPRVHEKTPRESRAALRRGPGWNGRASVMSWTRHGFRMRYGIECTRHVLDLPAELVQEMSDASTAIGSRGGCGGRQLRLTGRARVAESLLIPIVSPDASRMVPRIAQSSQLAQQVGDLVVDLRRVRDDQADAQEERRDRPDRPRPGGTGAWLDGYSRDGEFLLPAVVDGPRPPGDRRGDQVDDRAHVDDASIRDGRLPRYDGPRNGLRQDQIADVVGLDDGLGGRRPDVLAGRTLPFRRRPGASPVCPAAENTDRPATTATIPIAARAAIELASCLALNTFRTPSSRAATRAGHAGPFAKRCGSGGELRRDLDQ